MLLCGIDFESQSDDVQNTEITEVGALLVEVTHPDDLRKQVFEMRGEYSSLVWHRAYTPQSQKIINLTRITDDMLSSQGVYPSDALLRLNELLSKADYAVAHNKSFDEQLYYALCKRYKVEPVKLRWICTWQEIDYPPEFTCKKLSHLAFEHDIEFRRADLHRALDDVKLMMMLLAKYPVLAVIKYAGEPWVYLRAIFPAPFDSRLGFEVGKAKASKMGFGWEKARGDDREFPKMWVKRVKERYKVSTLADADLLALKVEVLNTA